MARLKNYPDNYTSPLILRQISLPYDTTRVSGHLNVSALNVVAAPIL